MTNYDNTNSGAMFKNDRKVRENQPDRNGSCEIKCEHCGENTEYWVAGWIKKAKTSGKQFMSLAFTPKEDKKDTNTGGPDNFDDDIPF